MYRQRCYLDSTNRFLTSTPLELYVQDAIKAAAKALDGWERTPGPAKRAIFLKAAALYESEKYTRKFFETQREETGASELWIRGTAGRNGIVEAAALATQLHGDAAPNTNAVGGHAIVYRKPHGVMYASHFTFYFF